MFRQLCSRAVRRRFMSTDAALLEPEPKQPYRILFFGSDDFSCASLRALMAAPEGLIEQIVVVTPPESKTGRGLKGRYVPTLEAFAKDECYETIHLSNQGLEGWLPQAPFNTRDPANLLITSSFGHMISDKVLAMFEPLNTFNVHPSMLPRFRGAAPIQWTIAHGDTTTGVSVQELSRGKFDHGRLLAQREMPVPPNSTFASLEPSLAQAGGELLMSVLLDLPTAQANATPQGSVKGMRIPTAPKLVKESARIAWNKMDAFEITRLHRGVGHSFPLWTTIGLPGVTLVVQLTAFGEPLTQYEADTEKRRGALIHDPILKRILVLCEPTEEHPVSYLVVERIRFESRNEISIMEWWHGRGKRVDKEQRQAGKPGLRFTS